MKNLVLFVVAGFVVLSCDKRNDIYASRNQNPVTEVTLLNSHSIASATWLSDTVVVDTLKMGNYYRFKLNVTDESHTMKFSYSGNGALYKNGELFTASENLEIGEHLFEWVPGQLGEIPFSIVLTDAYGKSKSYEFRINVFDNMIPEISWIVEHVGLVSPLDKKIVVSGEDGDELYGGTILYYEYVINQDTTIYPSNEFNHVFAQSGNYRISVRAKDSNNAWSNTVTVDPYVIQ